MSKYDAERALAIYKTFTKQTNLVVEFLGTARQYENATRLEIPKLKHAPTSLTASLEEYLNDPDFEVNRRQYLAQSDAKKGRKNMSNGNAESSNDFRKQPVNKGAASNTLPSFDPPQTAPPVRQEPRGPAPDLIDFFDSIEQNQQPMATQTQQQLPGFQTIPQFQQQQSQPTGFAPQQNYFAQNGQQPQPQPQLQDGSNFSNGNPFGQLQVQQPVQSNFTGSGFGGYSQQPFMQQQDTFSNPSQHSGSDFPQPQQPMNSAQQSFATSQQPFNTGQQSQTSNPFRQSMFPQSTGSTLPYPGALPVTSPQSPQSTNPFARNLSNQATGQSQGSPFTSQPQIQGTPFTSPPPPQPPQQQAHQLTPQRTGTNPFARTTSPPQNQIQTPTAQPLVANPTGTNPFRQSMFVNQQTGQSWQAGQGTMGGFEQMPTVPIFPRPGQPTDQQQQQQQQQRPWS